MSPESSPAQPLGLPQYQRLWAESVCGVLEQIAGAPFTFQIVSEAEIEKDFPTASDSCVWVRFAARGSLQGEQAFRVSQPHAIRLAQLLMGETEGERAALSDDDRDALMELMRQFAGRMAGALKAPLGGEVELSWIGMELPGWSPASQVFLRVSGPAPPAVVLGLGISSELAGGLAPSPCSRTHSEPPRPAIPENQDAAVSERSGNIDLLLDIELDARLCFGERQMQLRDVLECVPGTVVEVHRLIEQPSELWVAGRRIARGVLVVVDGNYGLRVTEIASPSRRMAALQTRVH